MKLSVLTRAFLSLLLFAVPASQAGLIGYWTFDDDSLNDLSGRGNHALLPTAVGAPTGTVSTPTFTAPSVSGADKQPFGVRSGATTAKYLNCNVGSGAGVWVPTPTPTDAYNFPGGRYSISFWTRNSWGLTDTGTAMVAKGGETYNAVAQGWQVQRYNQTVNPAFTSRGFGSNSGVMEATGANFGSGSGIGHLATWQHIAVVCDGTNKHIYINGFHTRTEAVTSGALVATNSKLTFGGRHNAATGAWEGFSKALLDDIALFDHALTAAEIEDLGRGADPRFGLRTSARPFWFGAASTAPTPAQGGVGYIGLRETILNGALLPGTSYSAIANPSDAILYSRASGTVGSTQSRDGTANPLITAIDFQDPDAGGLGANGVASAFLTNTAGSGQDNFFQVAQGAFQVATPGTYTFLFKGNDSMIFSILGANWDHLNANNGSGSISGETVQNGTPSADIGMIGVITLPAGTYNWRYVFAENTANAWNEVLYAPGEKLSYDATFVQLGNASGGLSLVDHVPMMDLRSNVQFISGTPPANITLTWDAAYATTVTLNGGAFTNQNVTASTVKGLGSVTTPAPTATTIYTITGVRGTQTISKSYTVYVNAPPVVNTFTVDDTTALAGQPLSFRWSVAGQAATANSVTISDGTTTTDITSLTDISGAGVITTLVAPASTRTYTLTATNPSGSSTAQLIVNVGTPPTISFTANDTIVEPDTAVTLSYNVPDANFVSISPNFSSTPTPAPSGSIQERVVAQSTYVLTASNDYGTSTAPLTIQVVQPLGVTSAGWSLTLYKANVAVGTLATAQQLIDGTIARGTVTVGASNVATPITINNQPSVNLTDGGGDGAIPGGSWPTASWGTAAIDNFVVRATATLVVTSTGEFTFNINNDDGGRLRIDLNNNGSFNDAGETIINDDTVHGPTTFTAEKILTAGTYPIEYVYFEQGGGAEGEVFYTNSASQNLLFTAVPTPLPITYGDLHITEIMASNTKTVKDGQASYEDYIEIYNGTGSSKSLAGYYLTDDPLVLNKWAFPTVPAPHTMLNGEYLLIFASSKNITLPNDEYHTNFKLDPDGEYLALTKSNGVGGYTIVQQFSPKFPAQLSDVSYGEFDSEHYVGFFAVPTPGARNVGGYDGFVLGETHAVVTQGITPVHNRGIYTAPITVTLTKDDPNAVLKYTTDGSVPSITVGTVYSTPLNISATTVLRSIAVRPNFIQSEVDTHSFIFPSDVLNQSTASATAKGWPSAAVNGQVFDYPMSPTIVSANSAAIQTALQSIPTISIVTDINNLVNAQSGIYVNPGGRGRVWERPASMELINDTGDLGGNFQINMGLRIRGGFSRSNTNPKHAWHFYFRSDYDGSLNYPLFGTEGATKFDQIDLQCPENYSWSFSPQNSTYSYTDPSGNSATKRLRFNTFVREPVSRDLYGDMGRATPKTRYYHCYVNGQYWGLYMSQERAEASFGETYLGGNKNDYDVVKSAASAAGYNTEATDGTFEQGTSATPGSAWAKLWYRTNEIRSNTGMTETSRRTMYFELMGLDAGGVPYNDPVNHPVVLDPAGLIDYMLITWYCGSFDAPLSTFLNGASNNWFGMRDRNGSRGFHFIPHDFEHGMGADLNTGSGNDTRSTDRTGPWGGNGVNYKGVTMYNQLGVYLKSNPAYIHENLCAVTEYRQLFADRAYRHLARAGGALTTANVLAVVDARAAVVRQGIIGESARWGDAQGVASTDFMPAPWDEGITQLKDWILQGSNAEYIASIPTQANPTGTQGASRAGRIIAQLRAYQDKVNLADATFQPLPLYSLLDAPVLSNLGGVVASGTTMTITNPNGATGTLYWSKDGTDPRLTGGGINPSASVQTGASPATITLTTTGTVVARVYNSATQTWSGLAFADFIVGVPASSANLVITEINYNPLFGAPGTLPVGANEQSYEFIELMNVSAVPIDLTNVQFTGDLIYTFPAGRILAAGERIVVVRDVATFQTRYPDTSYPGLSAKTVGPWTGGLDNGGELLHLINYAGADIALFRYEDDLPWPAGADGFGATAVFTNVNPLTADKTDGGNWAAHGTLHGNPGGPDITGYSAWAASHGASGNGLGDGDGDGISDLMEYFLGGSTTASSIAKLPVSARIPFTVSNVTADYQTLSFSRAPGTADLRVTCETRNSLTALDWAADAILVSRALNPDGSEAYVFRSATPISASTSQFMRIKVTLP